MGKVMPLNTTHAHAGKHEQQAVHLTQAGLCNDINPYLAEKRIHLTTGAMVTHPIHETSFQ